MQGVGYRVQGAGCRVYDTGFQGHKAGFRVGSLGCIEFGVYGLGFIG